LLLVVPHTLTFRQVAQAAGITEKTLRNWLDRNQVRLDAQRDRSGEKWRRFSVEDAVRIALIGKLSMFGIPIVQAASVIEDFVGSQIVRATSTFNKPENLSHMMWFLNDYLAVYDDGGLKWKIVARRETWENVDLHGKSLLRDIAPSVVSNWACCRHRTTGQG
jgi:DNA-binding transcriptional MerR regulator